MTCLIVSPRLGRLSAVPLVTDVVSPSSAATESYEDVSLDSNTGLNHVVRVSKHTQNKMGICRTAVLFFLQKRSSSCAEKQGEMSYEGSPVKAPHPEEG